MNTESSDHDSKKAAERVRTAQESVKAAQDKKDRAARRRFLNLRMEVTLGGALREAQRKDPDKEGIAAGEKQLEEYRQKSYDLEEEMLRATVEEREALEELAAASKELQEATVEPRVEAAKLRFEEHKLRATLCTGSIVGIAATSGILLPDTPSDTPSYIWVLGVSFLSLFVSMVLSLRAMKVTSEYVEKTLIVKTVDEPGGIFLWLTRHSFTAGLVVFAAFVVLNLMF